MQSSSTLKKTGQVGSIGHDLCVEGTQHARIYRFSSHNPSSTHISPPTRSCPNSSGMASLNWNPSQSNPPSSTLQSSPHVYSAPPFRTVEYASNPYASMPSYHQHMSSDPLSSSQMPSSIGPSRSNARSTGIVTRRKAAQQAAVQAGHVRDNSMDGQVS